MNLAIAVKTPDNKTHEVELESHDTVKDLYRKAGEVAEAEVGTFLLHFEGEELDDALGGNEIQHLGMWEGCELLLCCNVRNTMCVLSQELSSEETRRAMERRLEEDPDLLLQVEASGVDCLELHNYHLPEGLRHLQVMDSGGCVSSLGNDFLVGCEFLITLDLTSLLSVQSVGYGFLRRCKSLQSVDLTPFRRVTRVSDYFLRNCVSLSTIDLGPLQNATEVGDGFMSFCRSLKSIDLGPLRGVRVIGAYFLSFCSSLVSVNMQLHSVHSVGDHFLICCSSLTTINLCQLRENVVSIGDGFMKHCNGVPEEERKPLMRRKKGCKCVVC